VDENLNDAGRLRWEAPLVERAKSGDRVAMAELYRAFADRLYHRVLVPRLGNRDAAVDALGETFRVGFERLAQFESRGTSIYFWLSRIAVNKAMDMHRARATTGRALTSFETMMAPLLPQAVRPDEAFDAADDAHRARGAVERVLGALNPRYARAIRLRFFDELSRESCAEALEVTVPTFDVVLLRALRAFKKAWIQEIGEPR